MYSRPIMHGATRQRMVASAPLAALLFILVIASWAGREQLKSAITASGSFVAAQLGPGKGEPLKRGAPALITPKVGVTKPLNDVVLSSKSTAIDGPAATTSAAATTPKATTAAATNNAAATTTSTATGPNGEKVIVEVDDKGRRLQILDVPIPEDCHPTHHADFAGDAVVWGLGYKKASAAECCAACKQHQQQNRDRPCNIWVWCGDPSGICWTMDIHNHTTGDCWLKHQAAWDNNPDLTFSNLEVNHIDKFSADFRAVHKTSPEYVPWTAGVIPRELAWDMEG